MIKVRCDCGRLLTLKNSAAGRCARCPDCGEPLDVPELDGRYDDMDDYEDVDESAWEDDGHDAHARPRRRPSGDGSRSRQRRRGPKSIVLVGFMLGMAVFAVVGGAALAFLRLGRGMPDPPEFAKQIAENAPPMPHVFPQPQDAQVANADGDLWVVLSNLDVTRSVGAFGETVSVDYRIAQGQPDPAKKYVLYVGQSTMGLMEHYVAYDGFVLSRSGTIRFNTGPMFSSVSGQIRAFVGYSIGHEKWEKVSGEARPGQTTSETPPPTVQELAGADAEGKLFALANATVRNGPGPASFRFDLVLQEPLEVGRQYLLTAERAGEFVWQVDISQDVLNARQGETKTIDGRLIAVRPGSGRGPLTLHIEKRGSNPFRNEGSEIVSNRTLAK